MHGDTCVMHGDAYVMFYCPSTFCIYAVFHKLTNPIFTMNTNAKDGMDHFRNYHERTDALLAFVQKLVSGNEPFETISSAVAALAGWFHSRFKRLGGQSQSPHGIRSLEQMVGDDQEQFSHCRY